MLEKYMYVRTYVLKTFTRSAITMTVNICIVMYAHLHEF